MAEQCERVEDRKSQTAIVLPKSPKEEGKDDGIILSTRKQTLHLCP